MRTIVSVVLAASLMSGGLLAKAPAVNASEEIAEQSAGEARVSSARFYECGVPPESQQIIDDCLAGESMR